VSISNSSQISNFTPTKVETPEPGAAQPTGIFDPESTKVIGGDVKDLIFQKLVLIKSHLVTRWLTVKQV
jgi:hypothetical protein